MVIVWYTIAFGFDIKIISKGSRSLAELKYLPNIVYMATAPLSFAK